MTFHKPKQFLSLTGYTLGVFGTSAILLQVLSGVRRVEGKRRKKRRYTLYKNSCLRINCSLFWFTFVKL